ncbi:MAG: HD domain-containing protein [Moorea sp. SIO1F2]|uniref:bis(5'-nucleosyl)-tetraphosphatase (symmetrical) YqeK n=1 Tax=unclassified Moorena TaxID=2683338 RepID=UPI0013BC77F7|nr:MULTISPECIES: bis(5'-nucleosyl)-tetraphosphatase (symmetrical) YqeK [unclassified Moorena]NEN99304.1 HD domain-containing protein [Moorena sp. SIO3I7]NEO05959.1 HD domain-containing protein [Moorena sp. SIO3I8]NEO22400.1 HD domain-containing protein [Moorena sp. SIO4A5]NEP24517.1 HD domain-containing protein [Moorena sp. SIO3I6]NEQ61551.1 HD domain-containing protein [Moorena sp. SIO4A1]
MRDQVLTWLADNVPSSRLQHILRVEQMSVELAELHHINAQQAAQAGLLHDLAKCFKPERLLQMARDNAIEVDPVCEAAPHLLHADVSAIVAQEQFGVKDEAVLQAIALHTLGREGMTPLSCVVFIADTIEPGRGETPDLQTLRNLSKQDLYKTVWLACDYSLKFLLESPRPIHKRMILTRNWAQQMSRKTTAKRDCKTDCVNA